MTTYLDYKVLPADNNGPPPVGAPESHPTNQVNNIVREMMSVVRQLGDAFQVQVDALGSMALQDSDAVTITGGTISADFVGDGHLLTDLEAAELVGGPIPDDIFPPDETPLDVKVARCGTADNLLPATWLALVPLGTILLWYGLKAAVPVGWAICDGTAGTPDLQGRFVRGASDAELPGVTGGSAATSAVTDAQGAHDHGAAVSATALSIAQLPTHGHAYAHTNVDGSSNQINAAGGIVTRDNVAQQVIEAQNDGVTAFTSGKQIGAAGGGGTHTHAITAAVSHTHTVPLNPLPVYTAIWYIMRVS